MDLSNPNWTPGFWLWKISPISFFLQKLHAQIHAGCRFLRRQLTIRRVSRPADSSTFDQKKREREREGTWASGSSTRAKFINRGCIDLSKRERQNDLPIEPRDDRCREITNACSVRFDFSGLRQPSSATVQFIDRKWVFNRIRIED